MDVGTYSLVLFNATIQECLVSLKDLIINKIMASEVEAAPVASPKKDIKNTNIKID